MKNLSKYSEALSEALEGIVICTFMALSVIYIDDVKASVINAVRSCAFTIVPSLFVMCVLSSTAVNNIGVKKALSVFRINPSILVAFILGNIGGYPIGAKILKEMADKKQLTKSKAENAMCCCFASGPAFCLGIISTSVFKSSLLGYASVGAVFAANFLLLIFFSKSFMGKCPQDEDEYRRSFTDCVTSSVVSASHAMLTVCSSIIFFSAIIAILNAAIPTTADIPILNSALEISSVAKLKCAGFLDFVIITVLLAFGGICVHIQIKSLVGSTLSLKKFYLAMPARLALTALFSGAFYMLVQRYLPASSDKTNIIISQSGSIVPLLCVAGMSVISFTYQFQKNKRAAR